MRPSEARIEVNDDANVDDLSNVDCLFRWRRPDVVSEIAILLHPAERLSTSHVILATAEEHDILLPDRQCDRTVCMIVVKQVTSLTSRHRDPKRKHSWRPLASVIIMLRCYVLVSHLCWERYIFHRRVWYRALCLRDAYIGRSGIILVPWVTFVPNFVSAATSVAELTRGEKSCTQSLTHSVTHPAYLMSREPKRLCFGIITTRRPSDSAPQIKQFNV